MCQASSYTSLLAHSQPSDYACCPSAPSVDKSFYHSRMDSTTIDLVQAAPVVVRAQHLSYYMTIGVILLAVWYFQSAQAAKAKQVKNVPFYKASIFKWYFDAETLVRDSYHKVRMLPALCAI